jgi:subtilase family serine protease
VEGVEPSRRYVEATGTAAAAERAFSVHLNQYRYHGAVVQAPAEDTTVPADVAANVLAVAGLDTAPHLATPHHVVDGPAVKAAPNAVFPPGFRNARPCSLFYGQLQASKQADFKTPLPKFDGAFRHYAPCGYTPVQFRAAYGVDGSGLTGNGVTIAIVDAYALPTIAGDTAQYAANAGDAPFGPTQFSQSLPSQPFRLQTPCDAPGWAAEEALDIEAAHGIASDANVRYYAGRSCTDLDLVEATARVVDENRASIVSNSWGDVEAAASSATVAAFEQVFKQGAMQGIGFLFSSGDSGDDVALTGIKQADYPTSDPFVTAVGGTDTAIGPDGHLLWQTGWGTIKWSLSNDEQRWKLTGFLYGSGGGFSHLFDRPGYQNGVVPASSPAGRAIPDVALDGSPTTGMLIGLHQEFPEGVHYDQYRIGGTSLSSPLFAGIQALKQQTAGHRLGFANPAIYAAARNGSFTDVLPVHVGRGNVRPDYANGVDPTGGILYSVRTFGQDSTLTTTTGWDDVTGIGVPSPRYFKTAG